MRKHAIVASISLTLIALELVWTRIFSAEFFYTYAFLILSIAVLGLGLGGLALRLFHARGRPPNTAIVLSLAGVAALAGPPFVFRLGLDFSFLFSSPAMGGKFLVALVLLGLPFTLGGLALASIFRSGVQAMPRLYAADLLGAGAGVLVAILLMNRAGTPAAIFLCVLPILVGAFLAGERWWRALPLVPLVAMVILLPLAPTLLRAEREERGPVVYEHWDAMAKVKVYGYSHDYRGINIDNVANTPLVRFDGDWEAASADSNFNQWDINVGYLIDQFDECTFLSLGAGAGMDVLQALGHGATDVHAVEVNGHLNRMMLEGNPAGYTGADSTVVDSTGRVILTPEFSGFLYHDPRVRVVTEDARTYVRRHPNTFDVIFSLSSNTWAAFGSGSFALAESYLFTTEAFRDYWQALTPGGFLSMEHQVYMPRLVSMVIDALEGLGVEEPRSHFAVYDLPTMRRKLLLLSKRPLTDEMRYLAYGALTPERYDHVHLLYPAPDSLAANQINRIVEEGWQALADSSAIDLSPSTDDTPFVAQMGRWRNLSADRLERVSQYAEFRGFPMSKLVLMIILVVALVLVVPLNLLPYVGRGARLRAASWMYFFLIGMAFMIVEVVLIQKYALFIGASIYSISTVLLTLLIACGIGSRLSGGVAGWVAPIGIAAWLVLDVLLFRSVTGALVGLDVLPRALVVAGWMIPVGVFMGMPFPQGALRVGELVDWGFAVNGVASVVGATLAVVIATTLGFDAALLIGGGLYLGAGALASVRTAWATTGELLEASPSPVGEERVLAAVAE